MITFITKFVLIMFTPLFLLTYLILEIPCNFEWGVEELLGLGSLKISSMRSLKKVVVALLWFQLSLFLNFYIHLFVDIVIHFPPS